MTKVENMKSCPFCGNNKWIEEKNINNIDYGSLSWYGVQVVCDCGVKGATFVHFLNSQKETREAIVALAVEWWNTRK